MAPMRSCSASNNGTDRRESGDSEPQVLLEKPPLLHDGCFETSTALMKLFSFKGGKRMATALLDDQGKETGRTAFEAGHDAHGAVFLAGLRGKPEDA